jgi:F-type H+-transporting ATPase subunit delta
MSEQISLARPYAKAIFELARDAGEYTGWSDQLELLAMIAQDAAMIGVIHNPDVSEQQLAELIIGVAGDHLNEQGQNLVKLLVRNDRVSAVADINQQFLVLRDNAEQVIEAQLITASEVDEAQKKNIEAALSSRLGKQIKLETTVDESLIGGAIVRAGDWVVDGSVKAQLQELIGAISS